MEGDESITLCVNMTTGTSTVLVSLENARNSIFPELCPAYAQSGSLNSGSVNAKGKSKLNHSLHEYERKVKVQPKVLQNKGQVKGQAEVLKFFLCKLSPTFFYHSDEAMPSSP